MTGVQTCALPISAIEPLRAAKELSTTLEAEVELLATDETARRLEPYRDELAGLLLVAGVTVRGGLPSGSEPPLEVRVTKTGRAKCERCWTYRPDVAQGGPERGQCARCVAVLAARPAARG